MSTDWTNGAVRVVTRQPADAVLTTFTLLLVYCCNHTYMYMHSRSIVMFALSLSLQSRHKSALVFLVCRLSADDRCHFVISSNAVISKPIIKNVHHWKAHTIFNKKRILVPDASLRGEAFSSQWGMGTNTMFLGFLSQTRLGTVQRFVAHYGRVKARDKQTWCRL